MGSSLAAFNAGNIETIIVIEIEQTEIINIENKLISEGIELKKQISSGNRLILNTLLRNSLKFSTYNENATPKMIPKNVADVPMITPIKKKYFHYRFI